MSPLRFWPGFLFYYPPVWNGKHSSLVECRCLNPDLKDYISGAALLLRTEIWSQQVRIWCSGGVGAKHGKTYLRNSTVQHLLCSPVFCDRTNGLYNTSLRGTFKGSHRGVSAWRPGVSAFSLPNANTPVSFRLPWACSCLHSSTSQTNPLSGLRERRLLMIFVLFWSGFRIPNVWSRFRGGNFT